MCPPVLPSPLTLSLILFSRRIGTARLDPNSYFDTEQPLVQQVRLRWQVDFAQRRVAGTATLRFGQPVAGPLDLDTKGLTLTAVQTPAGQSVPWSLGPEEAILGQRLHLDLPAQTREVTLAYAMPQPIPPYLLALAVGRLEARDLGPRARIWAEPTTVEAAADEFAEVEAMIGCAESLFGPYVWDRYDMLVLPPSFPYGGMENPRMTFLTPTVLAGDRSLVDVVAHELAHSWTGNLVTNATMEPFWLNKGFTTWAERRILTALHGEEAGVLSWAIGQHALDDSPARFRDTPALTQLRLQLDGIDPDDAFSSIPYEKGARFVVALERAAGRERFDRFLRSYMQHCQFQSITTAEFLAFLDTELPGIAAQVGVQPWLYTPGMPPQAPVFHSATMEALTALAQAWPTGQRPTVAQMQAWSAAETLLFLQNLPRQLDHASLAWLDAQLQLTQRGNYKILVEWLSLAAGADYAPVFDRVCAVLLRVGRMKFLRPLYSALGQHARTRQLGREIYATARETYHSLSRRVVEGLMAQWATP